MNTTATEVPVTGEPYPLEVREVLHILSRRYPSARIETDHVGRCYQILVYIQGVLAFSERVYPDFIRRCNEREAG